MQENPHIEWQESWRDDFLKTVCGFANAEGGVLVIRRGDKGEAVGVKDSRKPMVDIPNKVRDLLGIMVEVNLHEEESAELVEIVVEPYPYPISYKGEYYILSGSTCQELKGAALDRFLGAMEFACRIAGSKKRPLLTRQAVDVLAARAFIDVSKARKMLGWQSMVPQDEGIRRTLEWLVTVDPSQWKQK